MDACVKEKGTRQLSKSAKVLSRFKICLNFRIRVRVWLWVRYFSKVRVRARLIVWGEKWLRRVRILDQLYTWVKRKKSLPVWQSFSKHWLPALDSTPFESQSFQKWNTTHHHTCYAEKNIYAGKWSSRRSSWRGLARILDRHYPFASVQLQRRGRNVWWSKPFRNNQLGTTRHRCCESRVTRRPEVRL